MKKFLFFILLIFPAFVFAQEYRVGIVASEGSEFAAKTIKTEIEDFISGSDSAKGEVYLYRPDMQVYQLDKVISDAFLKSDVMVFIGELSAGRAAKAGLLKPSVAVFPSETVCSAGFDSTIFTSINYDAELKVFQELFGFKKLKVLTSDFARCTSDICKSSQEKIYSAIKTPYEVIDIEEIVSGGMGDKLTKGDTLLVLEQPQLSDSDMKKLLNDFAESGIRTFSFGGYYDAELGMTAVNSRDKDFTKIARTAAVSISEIVAGKKTSKQTVMKRNTGLVINLVSAAKAGFSPTWHYMRSAELMNFEKSLHYDKYIAYKDALKKAAAKNEDVATGRIDLSTAKNFVQMSKSAFRPSVTFSANYSQIDDDRAKVARGLAPERSASVSLKLQQILYSEEVFALKDQAQYKKQAAEYMAKQAELDVIQSAAKAYLQVLRAKTYMSIAQDNLNTTKYNYDLARNRDMAGAANPADLYRWEASIALAKIDTVTAYNNVKSAMTELARLISEDIDGFYELEQVTLQNDYSDFLGVTKEGGQLGDQQSYNKFKKVMVEEAVKNSVELKTLKYLTEAADRSVLSAKRKFYQPTVALGGEYKQFLKKSGEGDETGASYYDDTDWSVGVTASIPIYEGGKRSAVLSIERSAYEKLLHQKAKATKLVRQRMIVALENARSSYDSYMLAGESAKAAEKTLELVSDLYSRGAVSITELIDAQNAKLKADLNEASSMYGFMEKIVDVERAFGSFSRFDDNDKILKVINKIGE